MAKKIYGLPYMGSKNAIAEWVVECLPCNEHFYDLFCGGCAITHAAMCSHKYKIFHVNDITPMGMIFKSLVDGTRKVDYKWVSREDFLQSDDYLTKSIWSFGNDCATYLYGKDVGSVKKALHYAIVEGDYTLSDEIGIDLHFLDGVEGVYERYLDFRRKYGKSAPPQFRLQHLERIARTCTCNTSHQPSGRTYCTAGAHQEYQQSPPHTHIWRQRSLTTRKWK